MNIKGFKTKDGSSVVQTGEMVDERIGDLAELTTEAKTSVVEAINEVAESGGSEIFYNTISVNFETGSISGADYTFAEMKAAIDDGKYVVLVIDGSDTHIPLYEYNNNKITFNQACVQGDRSGLFIQVNVSPSEDEGGDDTWVFGATNVTDTTLEIGELSDLTTTSKNNLVAAVNEVNEKSEKLVIEARVSVEDFSVTSITNVATSEAITFEDVSEYFATSKEIEAQLLIGSGRFYHLPIYEYSSDDDETTFYYSFQRVAKVGEEVYHLDLRLYSDGTAELGMIPLAISE